MKGFALTPDDGPPRIIRFVDLPKDNTLCVLDERTNVLTVNRPMFDRLDEMDKHRVERTHAITIVCDDLSRAA